MISFSSIAPVIVTVALAAGPVEEPPGVTVTIHDVIRHTLDNNFDITLERIEVKASEADVNVAQAQFGPALGANAKISQTRKPGASAFSDPEISENSLLSGSLDYSGKTTLGANYKAGLEAGQTETNSSFQSVNPSYDTAFVFEVAQPLLKDYGRQANLWRVKISLAASDIARNRLLATMNMSVASSLESYWELVYARENLETQKELLALARELERKVRLQVEAGALPQIEIIQAQASVASRKEQVIFARGVMENVADTLLRKMNPPAESPFWAANLFPEKLPPGAPSPVEEKDWVKMALESRPEFSMGKMEIESKSVQLVYDKNQELPKLDLVATLRLNGLRGDTQPVLDVNTGEARISQLDGGAGDSLADSLSGNYYDYSLGLRLTVPLDGKAAEGKRIRTSFELESAILRLKRLEREVALEAREALRQVRNSFQRIEAASLSRRLAEEKLASEMEKFEVGASTPFNVLVFQQDLATERIRELRAVIDCHIAKTRLEKAVGRILKANGASADKEAVEK